MVKAKQGIYEKYIKRILDIVLSLTAFFVLLPVYFVLTITGTVIMGGNPFFIQPRPGKKDPATGKETLFFMIKFRSMTEKKDENGRLLPDEKRLTSYGKFLRKTSLDELPQLINVIIGSCALVGPRPQLARDMVFMTERQRRRYTVRPGITGLAQINGRNNISWEQKFEYDLQYIDNGITFFGDLKIIAKTALKVFQTADAVRKGTATDTDFGDWLLENGKVTQEEYDRCQCEAIEFLGGGLSGNG